MLRVQKTILIFCLTLILGGCASLIADYNLQAYKNATDLKARSVAIIDLSDESFSKHQDEVEKLMVDINAAYEFAAGIGVNKLSARQWDIMRSSDRNLMGGYIEFWKASQGGVGTFFKTQAREEVASGFDAIICLEINKKESANCAK